MRARILRAGAKTTYYVNATGGLDSNSGRSPTAAWQTIAKVSGATFKPGDRILFKKAETWAEQLTVPAGNLYFGAYGSGALPIITGSGSRDHAIYSTGKNNIIVDGLQCTSTVWETINIINSNGSRVINCTTVSTGNAAISLNTCTNFDVYNNTISNSNANGITIVGCTNGDVRYNNVSACGVTTDDRSGINLFTGNSNVRVHHNISYNHTSPGSVGIRGIIVDTNGDAGTNYVYQNTCHHCDGGGIEVFVSNNQQVYYNICYANGSTTPTVHWNDGIYMHNCTGGLVYNNTCYGNKNSSIRCYGATGCTIKNNLGYQTGSNCFITQSTGATSHTVDNNDWYGVTNVYGWNGTTYATPALFYTATTQGQHDIKLDPVVVSTVTPDFHLQSDSPCRGAGINVSLTSDYDNVAVPSTPAIGAYEFV